MGFKRYIVILICHVKCLQTESEELNEAIMQLVESVSSLRHRYEALQSNEEKLR